MTTQQLSIFMENKPEQLVKSMTFSSVEVL